MAGARISSSEVSKLTRLFKGYFFGADNAADPAMKGIDLELAFAKQTAVVQIGGWNLYSSPTKTVGLSAYAGRVAGYKIINLFDDDGIGYDSAALWDSALNSATTRAAVVSNELGYSFGSAVKPIAHGYIDATATQAGSQLLSACQAGVSMNVVKDGVKRTMTFSPSLGIGTNNAVVVVNPVEAWGVQLASSYVITDGFVFSLYDQDTAVYFTIYASNAATPITNNHGNHTHSVDSLDFKSNMNLRAFQVIPALNAAGDSLTLMHNYHGQVSSGSSSFGGIEKTYPAGALPKYRSNSVNRGNILLYLDYPTL